MDGEWVHDGLVVEGKHSVEGIHELDLLPVEIETLAGEALRDRAIIPTDQHPAQRQKPQCDVVGRIGALAKAS